MKYMSSVPKKLLSLILAILLLAPSVLPIQSTPAYAADVDIDWTKAATNVGTALVVCKVGGWAAGLLEEVMGALGTLLGFSTGPISSTAENFGAAAGQTLTLGPQTKTGAEVVIGKDPAIIKGLAATGLAASFAWAVPTSDVYVQAQKAIQTEQDASLQLNTGTIADAAVQSATHDASNIFKDCVLDPFAKVLGNLIIDAVTDSIVAWIKSGFYGAPSFVEDPGQFFMDVASYSVSAFLYESGLDEILCEPFRLDIILGISWDFYMPDLDPLYGQLSCSLDEFFPGIEVNVGLNTDGSPRTMQGYSGNEAYGAMVNDGNIDFPGGGFPAVAAVLRNENNAFGSRIKSSEAAGQFVNQQVGRESTLLGYGKGWFSPRCNADNIESTPQTVCTPGEYVAEQVNDWSGGQLAQLELADEFAEIVNALLQLLVEKVLSEGNSLLQYRR